MIHVLIDFVWLNQLLNLDSFFISYLSEQISHLFYLPSLLEDLNMKFYFTWKNCSGNRYDGYHRLGIDTATEYLIDIFDYEECYYSSECSCRIVSVVVGKIGWSTSNILVGVESMLHIDWLGLGSASCQCPVRTLRLGMDCMHKIHFGSLIRSFLDSSFMHCNCFQLLSVFLL